MYRTILTLIVAAQITYAAAASAACRTAACQQAVAWKNGYTAVVLRENINRADYLAVREAVTANKAVIAIETERVFLGWMPASVAAKLRALPAVRAVLVGRASNPEQLTSRESALGVLTFFNHVHGGEYEDTVEAGLATPYEPLTNCFGSRSREATASDAKELSTTTVGGRLGQRFAIAPSWGGTKPFQNSDMRGRVTVQVFRLDSDGTTDANLYTWTDTDMALTRDQVYGAFTFWANEASTRGITLSFRPIFMDPFSRYCRCIIPTPTQYEPITHSSRLDYLWVNDALARQGYGASSVTYYNVYDQNEAFNAAQKSDPAYGPFDRSFSVYIVYNPAGAPSVFTDDQRAYTYADGPFVMMMWNSGGAGPNNIGSVLTHETGHIFWACDEYYDAVKNNGCFTCDTCAPESSAPRTTTNRNCEYPFGACYFPRVSCMMQHSVYSLCSDTVTQIGW